ncbi:DUF3667 domain-containing protein [Mangrovibacterium marinum]|uniref:DUF3667 domain-containing protein n=1 Tax=Mangrovibacterium marinum TaxID=1639118 RepID=UPI002A18CC00|nr:DUF3667 domain-containing protein [Mangrovibacterium marinum]
MNLKGWFKRERLPIEELEPHDCPNCGTTFQGYYCPNCGQSDTEFDRPFGFVFYNFMGDFFAFDSRFFQTFRYLLLKPGFLTSEFLEGRRQRYAPPFRIFIFLSFVLFLLLQLLTGRVLKDDVDWSPKNEEQLVAVDSLSRQLGDHVVSDTVNQSSDIKADSLFTNGPLESKLQILARSVDQKLQEETDPEEQESLLRMKYNLSSPRALTNTFLKYLSWAFFLMLPVLAVLLSGFYWRRKLHFIRHLVFSVHIHSFVFLLNILLVALSLIWHLPGWIFGLSILGGNVYIYMALKRFYGQGYLKTFVKFLMLGGVYILCVSTAIVWVIYNAYMNL